MYPNSSDHPTHPYQPQMSSPEHLPPPQAPTPERRRISPAVAAAVVAAGLLGGGVGAGAVAVWDQQRDTTTASPLTSATADARTVDATPGSVTYAAKVASGFTADIKVSGAAGSSVGSGIILTSDGYTLTNNHVVDGVGEGGRIQVTLPDGSTHRATITGVAPSYDLAVIKIDGVDNLRAATLGQSSSLQVGQQVVAVGSPENLSNTVTSGIISALNRTVTAGDDSGRQVAVYNGLQTDTPINPGNSGGPLVNLAGQVVGVNSAVDTGQAASGGVQAFGLGFSIPVDTAKRIAEQLMQDGTATKPVLGVSGSLDTASENSGARVQVTSTGAAAKAGIRSGEVITSIDGTPVGSYADLMAQVLRHTEGEQIPVAVTSATGATRTVTVTLDGATDTATTTVGSLAP